MVNEKRNLIDRSRFLRDPYFQEDRYSESHLLRMAIMEQPTVDAVEVVHGRWIARVDNDAPLHECSVCGARVVKGFYEYENPNLFCYHCGAKMDLEGD